jgi:pilus assembly protein CpaF
VWFPDEAAVRRFAQRLAAAGGRRLDDAAPYADVRLPDGVRLHAVLSPVAPQGTAPDGVRRVAEVAVPARSAGGLVDAVPAARLDVRGRVEPGPGWSRLLPLLRRGGRW